MSDDDDDALDALLNSLPTELLKSLPPEKREKLELIRERNRESRERGRERGRLFHQQLNIIFGTLGSVTLAALVLIIQDKKPFTIANISGLTPHQNFVFLVLLLSGVSFLALLSSLASVFGGSGIVRRWSAIPTFGYMAGLAAFGGFAWALVIIVQDISPTGGTIFGAFVFAVIGIIIIIFYRESRR